MRTDPQYGDIVLPQMALVKAVRYDLSRAGNACEAFPMLRDVWPDLDDWAKEIVRRDVESAFERDDRMRGLGSAGGIGMPLGWDDNRRWWEEVRALWRAG